MPNYTTTPTGGDRVRLAPPGESRDDLTAAEREVRLAELTLERFTLCPARAQRPPHRAERAAVRHLQRRARQASDLARSVAAASFRPEGRHRTDNLSEAGR